jgi:hypothetical protein
LVLCYSCNGVPLKFKKKNGGPPVYQHGLFEHSIDPTKNSLDNTFKDFFFNSCELPDQELLWCHLALEEWHVMPILNFHWPLTVGNKKVRTETSHNDSAFLGGLARRAEPPQPEFQINELGCETQ